ncbi:MAG: hypothetical protein ACLSGT_04670 [Oscillospiraceae bacterium]
MEKGWLARKTLESVQWSPRDDQVDFRQMYDERLYAAGGVLRLP